MTPVWSCGGGLQSAAIAALILKGAIEKPAIAVMADTGRERSTTWDFMHGTLMPALADIGVNIHIVPHSYATVDLMSGADGDTIIMPMHSSKGGILPKYCSNEWKTRPITRYLRERGITDELYWIGFSTDEIERCRREGHRYPLIEQRMSRNDCAALVDRMGWKPSRSSCWMCPYQSAQEWASLAEGDFQQAVALETELQKHDPDVWLHSSKRALAERPWRDGQVDLFGQGCDSGHCFT